MQKKHTLQTNRRHIGNVMSVLIEKESKKSKNQWAGRTNGNMWVVFDKGSEEIKNIVQVKIEDAQGVTLFGTRVFKRKEIYEAA